MKDQLKKELKLDIALIIISVICTCIFIGCIIVIALSGQPALKILAECTPWFILVAVTILFTIIFVWTIKRDVAIAMSIEEGKTDLIQREYKDRLERLTADRLEKLKREDLKASVDQIKGTENPDKKKVK